MVVIEEQYATLSVTRPATFLTTAEAEIATQNARSENQTVRAALAAFFGVLVPKNARG